MTMWEMQTLPPAPLHAALHPCQLQLQAPLRGGGVTGACAAPARWQTCAEGGVCMCVMVRAGGCTYACNAPGPRQT